MRTYITTLLFCFSTTFFANSFYVSTAASGSGNGSFTNPWQLQIALNGPSALQPGDTVWIRGGNYTGNYTSAVNGSILAPIIFRNYKNERVVLDGTNGGTVITINGSNTWFWGIESMSSDLNRASAQSGSSPTDITRGTGMNIFGVNIKIINCIVHDASNGIGFWTSSSTNSEIYGCVIYNNGWEAPDRGHGHGIYTQNNTGIKKIHNNIIFNGYSYGIHAYTEGGNINNFDIRKNICFNAGANNSDGFTTNILVGGLKVAQNLTIKNNCTYFSPTGDGTNNFGYSAGTNNMLLDSNYFVAPSALGGASAMRLVSPTNATITNNTLIGNLNNFSASSYPNNTYLSATPTSGLNYFVYPNKYEIGRANIVIYNWENLPNVQIDISNIGLSDGEQFELINAMDYFTDIILGTYGNNGIITIPMTGHTAIKPIGSNNTPTITFPQFGAFVVKKSLQPTGLNERANMVRVTAYPNPLQNKSTIQVNGLIINKGTVSIFNLWGKKTHSVEMYNNSALIDKQSFESGIYLYSVLNEHNIIVANGKIIVE